MYMSNLAMIADKLHQSKPLLFDAPLPGALSISDATGALLARFLGLTAVNSMTVTEHTALGCTAFYRGCSIIAGTIAGLPMKTYETTATGRAETPSFLDDPAGPFDMTDFTWKQLVTLHLVIHNECYLWHVTNAAGELIGLFPVPPLAVGDVEWDGAGKRVDVSMVDGTVKRLYTAKGEITQVLGLSTDGLRGVSLITTMRRAIQTGIAGEIAANKTMTSGMLVGGLVAPDTDMDEDQVTALKAEIVDKMLGPERAGDVMVVNRALKFSPWTMTNADAEFIASRQFQIEEFARMLGIPTSLLSVSGAVSNWGTGVAEANLGLARYTLMPYTSCIEAALKRLLPVGQHCEFEWKSLLQGTPAEEITLLLAQTAGGLLSVNEAREIMNLPPLTDAQKAASAPAAPAVTAITQPAKSQGG